MTEGTPSPEGQGDGNVARGFRLLAEAQSWPEVTVRDDQHEFAWLLDAARRARARGKRFRLVDSGGFDAAGLEWLAAAGADLYTSDDVRPDVGELIGIRKAGRASGAITAFFQGGPLGSGEKAGGALESLSELLRSGVDVHLSNREKPREVGTLVELSAERRARRSEFVYYHHGSPVAGLAPLAETGAWLHLSDRGLDLEAHLASLVQWSRSGRRRGGGLTIHLERAQSRAVLDDLRRAGVFLLHGSVRTTSRADRPLPFRAYFLDTTFMP